MTDERMTGAGRRRPEAAGGYIPERIFQDSGWLEVDPGDRAANYALWMQYALDSPADLTDEHLILLGFGVYRDQEARDAVSRLGSAESAGYDELVSDRMVQENAQWNDGPLRTVEAALIMQPSKPETVAERYPWADKAAKVIAGISGAVLVVSGGAQGLRTPAGAGAAGAAGSAARFAGSTLFGGPIRKGLAGGVTAIATVSQLGSIVDNARNPERVEAEELAARIQRDQALERQSQAVGQGAPTEPEAQAQMTGAAAEGIQAFAGVADEQRVQALQAEDQGEDPYSQIPLEDILGSAAFTGEQETDYVPPEMMGGFAQDYRTDPRSSVPSARGQVGTAGEGEWSPTNPLYTEASFQRVLGSWTPGQLEQFQDYAVRAGLIDPEAKVDGTGFMYGYRNPQTRDALAYALTEANANTETYWQTMRRLAVAGDEAKENEPPIQGYFQRGTYLAPDYAQLSNVVNDTIESRLGRKANDSEVQLLANQMQSDHRAQWEQEESQRRANWVSQGRAMEEGFDEYGGGELEEVNWQERFADTFRDKYAPEMDRADRLDVVAAKTQSLMSGLNNAANLIGR